MLGEYLRNMKDSTEMNSANVSFPFGLSVRRNDHMVSGIRGSGVRKSTLVSPFG